MFAGREQVVGLSTVHILRKNLSGIRDQKEKKRTTDNRDNNSNSDWGGSDWMKNTWFDSTPRPGDCSDRM
jgi:hypothetical protein